MFSHVWSSARFKQWRAMMISIEGLLKDEQGLSMGEMLIVKFRQPSHEFTFGVDISFILYPLVLTPLVYQVHSCMSVLEFSVYAGFWRWKQDFRDKFIKHLVTRPWSLVQIMQWSKLDSKKPRDQTREDDKLRGPIQKSVEPCGTRSYVQLGEKLTTRDHMQKGEGSRRLGNQRHAKEAGNWAGVGPGQPAHSRAQSPPTPLDIAAIRAIYSPGVKSHASINLSSATEEQRREGHHPGEERVELVD
jgi:hypothetical protein